ncbi:MAG: MoxR family ATPase [Bdellovibrionaceae bacterium]|nr:MoxR family ATPase [Pseudobdellovibrionaceae bacterium]
MSFPKNKFLEEARKILVGKEHELELALVCLLSRGHLLIEDLPGMGKTTFVLLLSQLLDLPLKRIQFTNDLLPTDILGFQTLDQDRKTFTFHPGPIFSELVLADELNRGTPKTQSALLQAMEEKQVTIDGVTHPLPEPFFMVATQNPQEHSGTSPLPESQLDRFMMCLQLGFPSKKDEMEIFRRGNLRDTIHKLPPVMARQEFIQEQKQVDQLFVSDPILAYIHDLLQITRGNPKYPQGLSSRCGILLLQAAKARGYLQERNFVIPEDVKYVAPYCLSHRLANSTMTAKLSTHENILDLINTIPIPE